MANRQHLRIINKGVAAWNAWRRVNSDRPDLNQADLSYKDLSGAHLNKANLSGAELSETDLREADLKYADLSYATLVQAKLRGADLRSADLSESILVEADFRRADLKLANLSKADLRQADFSGADLKLANLGKADLREANFSGARLYAADFSGSKVGWTVFGATDLSTVKGLQTITHVGPSTIGVDTLYQFQGHIAEAFLRGVGVPEEFITQIPALIASVKPTQFQSCFISHSHRDEEFARRLHAAMRAKNLRVWFAPEEMKGGKKLHDQIFHAIQVHDRLLLVLSTESMKSEWVMTEIRRAKKVEREENRRKLFPIRLVDFETIQNWECFDADSGKDLAAEVREYYLPDFSNWKDHDSFELELRKLLRDLRSTER